MAKSKKFKNWLRKDGFMRLGKYLSSLTKPEVERLRDELNLTDEEERIYNLLKKNKSIIEISDKLLLSESTLKRRIKDIQRKVDRIWLK